MSLILVSLCGLISCVSQHKHLLVHLSCHSITKTKQGPFNALCAEVLLGPERDRQSDAPQREHRMWAHSEELARGSQLGLRDLQLLERCIADDVEASPSINQHVIEPDVGYDRGGD